MLARSRQPPPKKRRTSVGPKKLLGGYWQEADEDDDIDIFEWISPEDLEDEPPARLSKLDEVAACSSEGGFALQQYAAPEYRTPTKPLQLAKGIKTRPPLDQCKDRFFLADVAESLSSSGRGLSSLGHLDVVTSLSCLNMLLAFIDGRMIEDLRAKGLNTSKGREPELVDLMRILRVAEAPRVVCLASVWNWVPANSTPNVGALNRRSYDVGLQRAATGRKQLVGPPSTRLSSGPSHHRMLEYECGDLRMLVRVPVVAKMPAVDLEAAEGHAVDMETANYRSDGHVWDSSLPSKYAEMQLGDTAMLVRAVVEQGTLVELQELTREDLRLDRPSLPVDADRLLGKLAGLLRRVRAVADCPGCKDRPLYLQYSDAELRIIAPIFGDEDDSDDMSDAEVAELLGMPLDTR